MLLINLLFSFLLFSLVDFKFPFKDHIIIVSVLIKCGIDEMVMRPVMAWKCAAEEKTGRRTRGSYRS